ncbi:hypothetical protein F1D05_13345 [Kribbella qitaiheensis]|uniref:Uncharacterized protein n=1 Tax=Kribbella qitaiheensis TaxID=1544730 RepID=A0A7G6WXJ8_9ACTN|nr:hypothetical protein [Kribbella qitaiheensis]QNE18713.1 hypothetical protein F1D05_13345 [Kribbella qitaiheensis]
MRTVRSGAFSFITYVGSVTGTGSHRPSAAGTGFGTTTGSGSATGSFTSTVISWSGEGAVAGPQSW